MSEDKYCVEITTRGKRCTEEKYKGDQCLRHYNLMKKKGLKTPKGPTKECTCGPHNSRGSKYLKGKVPIEKFHKVSKSDIDLFSMCIDCRTYHRNQKNGIPNEKINDDESESEEIELEEESDDEKERCTEITVKSRRCKREAVNGTLCQYHYNFKLKQEGKFNADYDPNKDEGETKICGCPSHISYGSKYPKEKVPIIYFQKAENDSEDLFLCCIDCRNYGKNMGQKRKKNLSELEQSNDENFKVCRSLFHDIKDVSIFPRNAVPINLFSYKSKDSTQQSNSCIDCRKYNDEKQKKYKIKIRENAEKEGKFYCRGCNNKLELYNKSINEDGSLSAHCVKCKEKKKEYTQIHLKHMRETYRKLQKEFMNRHECSCERCKSIFIKPTEDIKYVIELPTYEINNLRYINYNGKEYLTKKFLEENEDLLEFRILEFDHLDEQEQRERGIINENEDFIKKKNGVSGMHTAYDMRKESKITQILCCKCHLIVTILRESENKRVYGSLEKVEYVNNLKFESGCEICGFNDTNLLRYLEFDHLDPELKVLGISEMMKSYKYTLEQLIEECKKCRILCRSCHKLHTHDQRQQGII